MMILIFWVTVVILVYAHFGYPLLLTIVGRLQNRRVRKQPVTPRVSLIIAAYNEERTIADRLENALALDYPPEALEIIVASDGSDDATNSIVNRYAYCNVRLLELPRQGKIYALAEAIRHANGEILVFSDANTVYDKHALKALARNFADPAVGGVAGNTAYTLRSVSDSSARGENLYWSYDKWLKHMESLTGNIVSAHGGIYAIRRSLFRPLSSAAVTDDFAISTGVVEQGYRLVFESEAMAYEPATSSAGDEFGRKVRLMTRGMRGVLLQKHLMNPFRYGFYSVVLFSHKVLRRLVPWVLLALLACSIFSIGRSAFYLWAAAVQVFFYGLAAVGFLLRGTSWGAKKFFYIPFFYCMANGAALVAMAKVVLGQRIESWQPQRHEAKAWSEGHT